MSTSRFTEGEQFAILNTLELMSDLFTMANRETFTKESILLIFNNVMNDEDIFDPDVLTAYAIATQDIDATFPREDA